MKTPNKMKSPMKDGYKHDHPHDRIDGVPASGLEGMGKDGRPVAKEKTPAKFTPELRQAKADNKLNPKFAAVVKMKSPAKMASGFKMKSAPVNMRTPGSIAKMAGVSPMKNTKKELRNLANANDFAKTTSKENQDAYKKAVESRLGKETNL